VCKIFVKDGYYDKNIIKCNAKGENIKAKKSKNKKGEGKI